MAAAALVAGTVLPAVLPPANGQDQSRGQAEEPAVTPPATATPAPTAAANQPDAAPVTPTPSAVAVPAAAGPVMGKLDASLARLFRLVENDQPYDDLRPFHPIAPREEGGVDWAGLTVIAAPEAHDALARATDAAGGEVGRRMPAINAFNLSLPVSGLRLFLTEATALEGVTRIGLDASGAGNGGGGGGGGAGAVD